MWQCQRPRAHGKSLIEHSQLIARLSTHELISSRAFSSAVEQSKRPTAESGEVAAAPTQTVRHFNTSRSLKAVNDSSTIDFAYLPAIEPDDGQAADFLRVPIVPDNYNPPRTGAHAPEAETVSPNTLGESGRAGADCVWMQLRSS